MKGINKNKRPMITDEEIKEYNRIIDEYKILDKERKEYIDMFCAKFRNGTKLINDFKNNKIVLNSKGVQLDIDSLLPDGVKILFNQKEDLQYIYKDKTIISMAILDEIDFFILLHEIGHAWGHKNNPEISISYNMFSKSKYIIERDAWAWAFKKMKQLRKDNFIDNKFTDKELMLCIKAILYEYGKYYKPFTNYTEFLRKDI